VATHGRLDIQLVLHAGSMQLCVGGILSMVRDPWANSCFRASITHVLLYMTMMNLSISYSACGLMKVYVMAGHTSHANHADFFPRQRKLETVSHPLRAWHSSNAFAFSSFRLLAMAWIAKWRKWYQCQNWPTVHQLELYGNEPQPEQPRLYQLFG
jgi:hypothetical protein